MLGLSRSNNVAMSVMGGFPLHKIGLDKKHRADGDKAARDKSHTPASDSVHHPVEERHLDGVKGRVLGRIYP